MRAYLDFFEDEMVALDYDWRAVVRRYLLAGPAPLVHGAAGALGGALVHLGVSTPARTRRRRRG